MTEGPQFDLLAADLRCLDVADINAGRLAARNTMALMQDGGESTFGFAEHGRLVQVGGVESAIQIEGGRLLVVLAQVSPEFLTKATLVEQLTAHFGLEESSAKQTFANGRRQLNTAADDEVIQSYRQPSGTRARLNPKYVLHPIASDLPKVDPYEVVDLSLSIDDIVIANPTIGRGGRKGGRGPVGSKKPKSRFPENPVYKKPGPHDVIDSENWTEFSKCANVDPSLLFPGDGSGVDDAKKFCKDCPVKGRCLEYALATRQDFGVWGGTSERERRKILKKRAEATLRPLET